MAQLAVVLLALFGQMERTYTMERAAHARAVTPARPRGVAVAKECGTNRQVDVRWARPTK